MRAISKPISGTVLPSPLSDYQNQYPRLQKLERKRKKEKREKEREMRGGEEEDHQSRDFYELCALLFTILRHPPLPSSLLRASPRRMDISPAGFASLLLGISLALMLCGSITFFVGFILMPWVFGFVMVFYLVGLVSNLSVLGRAIMVRNLAVVGPGGLTGRMDMPGPFFSKFPIL
ncbi:uncharacterized protein LOC131239470 [Magnolia sinica]|uniref:uncharacterized protein LOC131239470 n=1 Tax=Magnolia sinica TaxID=86752 RepID=UPI0026588F2F|nr:uncharacterized protein LOC131239470 [Magnolia sinica]